ncbi:MAG TPA: hypothetical protein VIM62_04465 [Acidobacteriaceae bacterium]
MTNSGSFDVEAFGLHLRLTAGCADASATLDQYAFPWLQRVEAKAGRPDLDLCIDKAAGEFRLLAGCEVVAAAHEPLGLVRALIQVLDETVVQRLTTLRAVHAGVVAWNGRVLLFPGASHAGKSALSREFLRRGATYFSDEYALIDAAGYVHPYPRPLLVRDGGEEQSPLLARALDAPVGDKPLPLGWIFAIAYRPEGGWNLGAMSQGEALMVLLGNTPHTLKSSPDMIGVFQSAVSGAQSFVGTRGEAADAVDRILNLIGG